MKRYLISISFLLFACTMEPAGDYRLRLVNHTSYQFGVDYNFDTIPQYPSVINTDFYFDHPVKISDTIKMLEKSYKPWSQFFKRNKTNKLNLFIYNIDSLKKYDSIDTLIKRKIYKNLKYSEQQLKKLNWIVVVKDK